MGEIHKDRSLEHTIALIGEGAFGVVGDLSTVALDGKTVVSVGLTKFSLVDPSKLLVDPKKIGLIKNVGLPKTSFLRRKIDPIWGVFAYLFLGLAVVALAIVATSALPVHRTVVALLAFWCGILHTKVNARGDTLTEESKKYRKQER